MRTIVTESIVYSFDDMMNDVELKDKVLEKHRDINTNYRWWDSAYDMWKEDLHELGFYETDISFSGFYSQGDGASFTGRVDVYKWIKKNDINGTYRRLLPFIGNAIDYSDRLKRDRWHNYVHYNTTSLYIDWNIDTIHNLSNIESLLDKLEEDIYDHHVQLNKDIYSSLEVEHDYMRSDEYILESLEGNGYEFDEEGNTF
jgi:hypothetical protein